MAGNTSTERDDMTITDTTAAMLIIKSIAPDASLELSEWTGKWYVSANIEISDGACLTSTCEHENTPDLAVRAYLNSITQVGYNDLDRVLVTHPHTEDGRVRRHWRWNGQAFVEEPVERFRQRHSDSKAPA